MSALMAQSAIREQTQTRGIVSLFPDDMRAFVRYECDPTWTPETCLLHIKQRWPEPYPAHRTIDQWRAAGNREREACRRQVWEREWAGRASYLVPKCLVSLDKALTEAVSLLDEARGNVDGIEASPRLALQAIGKINDVAGQMLTHLGAPTLDHQADPESIRREALAALMAAGQSAQEAEAVLAAFAAGPAAALGAGSSDE